MKTEINLERVRELRKKIPRLDDHVYAIARQAEQLKAKAIFKDLDKIEGFHIDFEDIEKIKKKHGVYE